MKKEVQIKVDKCGDKVRISNNLGMHVEIVTNRADNIVSALVGLTMAEFYKDSEGLYSDFQMTLYVEGLTNK